MGFTNYSTPIKPASFEAPLDLDLYAKGTLYKENLAKANLQDISASYNNVFNIPTYGKDKEKIAELEGNLKNELSQMNLANLGNMETASQIKNLISKYSQNKDVMGIAQRYGSYQNELKKKEDAESKGGSYYSSLLKDANKYYNSGEFLSDKRFNKPGYLIPEVAKLQNELIKNNEKSIYRKVSKQTPDGNILTYNKVDGNKAADLWKQQIEANPTLKQYYFDQFQDQNEEVDWDSEGSNLLLNAYQNSLELARLHPEEADYYLSKADQQLKAAQSGKTGNEFKMSAFNDFITQDAHDFGNVKDALDVEDIKADAFKLENARTANNIYEYKEKAKIDAGVYANQGIPAKQKATVKVDINGQPIDISYYSNVINNAYSTTPTEAETDQVKDWVAQAYNKANPSSTLNSTDLVIKKEGNDIAVYKKKYKQEGGKRVQDGEEKVRSYSKDALITTLTPGAQKDIEGYETSKLVGTSDSTGAKYNTQ